MDKAILDNYLGCYKYRDEVIRRAIVVANQYAKFKKLHININLTQLNLYGVNLIIDGDFCILKWSEPDWEDSYTRREEIRFPIEYMYTDLWIEEEKNKIKEKNKKRKLLAKQKREEKLKDPNFVKKMEKKQEEKRKIIENRIKKLSIEIERLQKKAK